MTKRVNNRQAHACITKREAFQNSTGSLRGVTHYSGRGRLPLVHVRPSLLNAEYVVYSYATPIAWVCRGRWYYPSVSYSPTTTQHQHAVRMGMTGTPCYLGGDWRKAGAKRAFDGVSSMRVSASTGMPSGYFGMGV